MRQKLSLSKFLKSFVSNFARLWSKETVSVKLIDEEIVLDQSRSPFREKTVIIMRRLNLHLQFCMKNETKLN